MPGKKKSRRVLGKRALLLPVVRVGFPAGKAAAGWLVGNNKRMKVRLIRIKTVPAINKSDGIRVIGCSWYMCD